MPARRLFWAHGAPRLVQVDNDGLLSTRAAATRLKVSMWTLRRWARAGAIPYVRLGKLMRFEPSVIAGVRRHGLKED